MADTNPPGPDKTPDADLPASLASLTFHGPLSEARASRLVGRLTRTRPATVLDIGCGWGELLLRMLAAAPGATGVGLDTDQGDLARGRDNARARGLEDRVAFVRESGVGTTRGPADLVLCVEGDVIGRFAETDGAPNQFVFRLLAGRLAMLLAEQEARARGMTCVGLNVHGSNVAARACTRAWATR